MSTHDHLHHDLAQALSQGALLIAALPDALYQGAPQALPCASTVGAHCRHVLGHVQQFLEGLSMGEVDYDARQRDKRVELERDVALTQLNALSARLRALSAGDHARCLHVAHCVDPSQPPVRVASTRERELMFLLSHTIHHWAIVRMLVELHGAHAPACFGYMPSTLRHMQQA